MSTPNRRRVRRSRAAAGALAVGLVVLVGCDSTIDGRAVAGETVATSSSTSRTTSTSESTESTASTDSTDSTDSTASTESSSSSESSSEATTSTGGDTTGSDPTSSATGSSPSTGTSSSSDATSSASTTFTGNPDNLTLTAPGTELAYGAAAVLPFSYADAEGVFTVGNLTVTKGSEADWATLGVDTSDAQGEEPWYVRMNLKQESGGDFSYTSVQDDFWAYSADGDPIDTVYPDDDTNTLCPISYAQDGFTVGDSYDACVVLSVNVGESVSRIQFEGGYDSEDPYYDSPVVWKG